MRIENATLISFSSIRTKTYMYIRNIQMFLNNIRTDEFLWFWPLDFIPYREMEWNLDFDGIEERQRDCGKDRNRGLPAMALIVNEFTSFLRRFVIRLNCVYGMEFMSCDSSFDLLCLSFFFFFWCYYRSRVYSRELFLLTQLFSLQSLLKVFEQQMWFWFLQGVVFKLMQEQEKYIIARKWNY